MTVNEQIAALYEKDTKAAYANLLALDALSDEGDTLYPHLPEFIAMLQSPQYVIRVRGFRLLCKQAKWDGAGRIDAEIDGILAALDDDKPTAVRQMLQYLALLAPCKPALHRQIKAAALAIDFSRFRDTMAPLIMKDVQGLLGTMEKQA